MLTEQEKKWLEEREERFAIHGIYSNPQIIPSYWQTFALTPDYKDAAEFEARVAALMAQPYSYTGCHQCYYSHEHKCSVQMHKENIDFRWCLLKFRRIAVEEMMEEQE